MEALGLNEIRRRFLDFFSNNDHLVQPSYPLVPQSDKTLLLINAGMVPLKDFFTGVVKPPAPRMASCQKCIRTNDIENVGVTSRHASFFEMLGNFSFGDYFKREAIRLAWQFVTDELQLDRDKIWVSVYLEDDEARDIWHRQEGVPLDRIVRLGKEDNFWEIGTGAGPCGPCSELYYDRGAAYGCGSPDCQPGCDCDRYVEFWNLVFTQFEQSADGSYTPLEKPNIDTGMGLERIACITQGVDSLFDIDVMVEIRDSIARLAGCRYGNDDQSDVSIRIITDHIRAIVFLVSDGVVPNNEGRGYVLRRLLRRAARHGKKIGIANNFLYDLADVVIAIFGEAYPDLVTRRDYTKKIIKLEEERFMQTIDQGLVILDNYIADLQAAGNTELDGDLAFKLYDTYGFPLDLTMEILADKALTVDQSAFEAAMQRQRQRARSARDSSALGWSDGKPLDLAQAETTFCGYAETNMLSKVIALMADGAAQQSVDQTGEVIVILDQTPFYAESGGQVGDIGTIYNDNCKLRVSDTQKNQGGTVMHHCQLVEGKLAVGDVVSAQVDSELRLATARNHTATHLLHRALKDVLGDHVEQSGSLVDSAHLRFDFRHFNALSTAEIERIETIVNQKILAALPVETVEMPIAEAKAAGATALFGEKYGDVVRVVSAGSYSVELCGGTHLGNTAQIGQFKIVSEGGVAAGVRRIEAISGTAAQDLYKRQSALLDELEQLLKSPQDAMLQKVSQLLDENKRLQRELDKIKQAAANDALTSLQSGAQLVKGVQVISGQFADQQADALRNLADQLSEADAATLVVLANVKDDKVNFIAMANPAAVAAGVHCGNVVKQLAKICGGGGGGRPNMAQAGGRDATKLKVALQQLPDLL